MIQILIQLFSIQQLICLPQHSTFHNSSWGQTALHRASSPGVCAEILQDPAFGSLQCDWRQSSCDILWPNSNMWIWFTIYQFFGEMLVEFWDVLGGILEYELWWFQTCLFVLFVWLFHLNLVCGCFQQMQEGTLKHSFTWDFRDLVLALCCQLFSCHFNHVQWLVAGFNIDCVYWAYDMTTIILLLSSN